MYLTYLCVSVFGVFFLYLMSRIVSTPHIAEKDVVDGVAFYAVILTICVSIITLGWYHTPRTSFSVALLGLSNAMTGYVIKASLEQRMYESWKRSDLGLSATSPLEMPLGKTSYLIAVVLGNMGIAMMYSGVAVGLAQL